MACVQRKLVGTREIRIHGVERPQRDAREGQARWVRKSERSILCARRRVNQTGGSPVHPVTPGWYPKAGVVARWPESTDKEETEEDTTLETKSKQCWRFLSPGTGKGCEAGPNRRAGCPPRGGIRRACGEPPGRNRRARAHDEPVGQRQEMVEPAVWGRRHWDSILSHQGVCGRHGGKDTRVTRGGLAASRPWQAGKRTYKLEKAKWEAMRGEESDSRIVLTKPWETMCHRHQRQPGVGWGSRLTTSEARKP
jgi:hypothetical protein